MNIAASNCPTPEQIEAATGGEKLRLQTIRDAVERLFDGFPSPTEAEQFAAAAAAAREWNRLSKPSAEFLASQRAAERADPVGEMRRDNQAAYAALLKAEARAKEWVEASFGNKTFRGPRRAAEEWLGRMMREWLGGADTRLKMLSLVPSPMTAEEQEAEHDAEAEKVYRRRQFKGGVR